jgi:hypothetical protein
MKIEYNPLSIKLIAEDSRDEAYLCSLLDAMTIDEAKDLKDYTLIELPEYYPYGEGERIITTVEFVEKKDEDDSFIQAIGSIEFSFTAI